MHIQRIYLDTSVIGGCFDPEFARWSQGLIKDLRLRNFRPVVSEVVAAEIENAPEAVRQQYAEVAALPSAEFLHVTAEVLQLAEEYQRRGIVSPKYYDDGTHIALATSANVDLLASWNFKHIVHFEKIRQFNAVNLERGYRPLHIYSPREVTHYGED